MGALSLLPMKYIKFDCHQLKANLPERGSQIK